VFHFDTCSAAMQPVSLIGTATVCRDITLRMEQGQCRIRSV